MRGNKKGLTLRKGIVEEKPIPHHYKVRDLLNGNLILTSVSAKLRMENFDLEIGETVYVIVGIYDLVRGRLAVDGHRGGLEEYKDEKEILDKGVDPMGNNQSTKDKKFKIKQIGIITEIIDASSFKAKIEDGSIIKATISGKMKMNLDFDIYVGEKVPIVISPYDRTRGRINFRHSERTKPNE